MDANPIPVTAKERLLGSGTVVVNVTSSITKEPPAGPPVIEAKLMPARELT